MKLELHEIDLPLDAFALRLDAVLEGRITGIVGRSGAGKTSLLELVAGLRRPRSARIVLDGVCLQDTSIGRTLPARERGIGYVPQDLALFPHLSVRDNVTFARNGHANEGPFSLPHVTEALQIAPLLDRSVRLLSGGEKQRVALARALLARPRLLLLDEPMEGLDWPLRQRARDLLRQIDADFGVPMLYVSHSSREITDLCDDVMVLERGVIVERGKPSAWARQYLLGEG
jgi:molybdate transport system ATP-binding protein